MTIKLVLRNRPKQNGTHAILVYVFHNKRKKYLTTELSVAKDLFDIKRESVKKTHPSHLLYNAKLTQLKREIEDFLLGGGDIEQFNRGGEKNSFIAFLDDYIGDIKEGLTDIKLSTAKNYSSTLTRIKQYQSHNNLVDIYFDDITIDFYNQFKRFLFANGCGSAGFGKHVKIIKTIMRNGQDLGLHSNEAYKSHLFKRPRQTKRTGKIYLTEDDIKKIEEVDLSYAEHLEKERDRFIVSYYFLMRFEDSKRISKEDIFEKKGQKYIRYKQQKTEHTCVVPVNPKALVILEKYNYKLDFATNVQANRYIKTICAAAYIDEKATEQGKTAPKWQFVTTHTARRSAATNLSLNNVSIKIIADLGGWKDLDTLRVYLRSSGLDTANVAKDLDFFTS